MPKLDKMFGGTSAEQKWKKEHSSHISEYNQKYHAANKERILAQRKITRTNNKGKNHNKFLGY